MSQYKARGNRNQNYQKPSNYFKKISVPLTTHYKDKEQIYLVDGIAYKKAEEFNRIPPHQLRKILQVCKESSANDNFNEAKIKLFSAVPMAAYNAGRDSKLRGLYEFVVENINENTIKTTADIQLFNDLFTAIIAFHKSAYRG